MKVRVFEMPDGSVRVTRLSPSVDASDAEAAYEHAAEQIEAHEGVAPVGHFDVDESELPEREREDPHAGRLPARDAWRAQGGKVVVDDQELDRIKGKLR